MQNPDLDRLYEDKMNYGIYRTCALFLFGIGILGLPTVHAAEKNKKKEQKNTPIIASVTPEKSEIASNWDLDAFIAQNFTIFKENLPLKRAEKIIDFLNKNGLSPELAIAPEFEGEKREPGEDPTYDILIPLSEQTALENLLVAELEKKKEYNKRMAVDITPSARGCCQKKHGFVLSAEFLYWKITEDDLLYGARTGGGQNLAALEATGLVNINFIEQPFEWDPGVRVGVGYNLPWYGWDVDLKWTYIQSKPKFTMFQPGLGILSKGFLVTSSAADPFATQQSYLANILKANWHLVYNSLDLVVGRNLYLSYRFSIRPNGGLKTAWIHQKQGQAFDQLQQFTVLSAFLGPVHTRNDFWGIGPKVGLDSRYVLPLNFGLFFQTGAALIYGKFDVETNYLRQGPDVDDPFFVVTIRNNKHRLSPWLQLELGLDWSLCFGKNRNILFRAGYECQIWWDQWRARTNLAVPDPKGDLMMNGLTLQGKFDF